MNTLVTQFFILINRVYLSINSSYPGKAIFMVWLFKEYFGGSLSEEKYSFVLYLDTQFRRSLSVCMPYPPLGVTPFHLHGQMN